jgi:hypothetical protein
VADLTNAPRPLAELYEWLVENSYTVLNDAPGGAFNQYVVLRHGASQIAFRGDRGDWDLTVSLDAGRTFWQIDQLEAFLDGHPWIGDPSSDEQRADFVRSRLRDLRDRLEQDPNACEELYRLGDEWMSWRLGIPIPNGGFPGRKPC